MNKNYLNCYYLIEGNYKVSEGSKAGVYNVNESFENENLLLARQTAFCRFNELVYNILEDNSIMHESEQEAYNNLQIWFLKCIIAGQPLTAQRRIAFIGLTQYLSLKLVVDCNVIIGEQKKEVSSIKKYAIYGINDDCNIIDYLENLQIERGIYNYLKTDISHYNTVKRISLDSKTKVGIKMLDTDLERLMESLI